MPEDLPILCSLDAAQLPQRLDAMAALGRDALLDHRANGPAATLVFADRPGVRDRLDAIVAAEARCCAFLTIDITRRGHELVLTIAAPEDAALAVTELVDAFRDRPGRVR